MDIFDISLYVSYILVIVTALAAVVLPLINSLSDPKKLAQGALGIGILLVVFFVGYLLAGNEVTSVYVQHGVNESSSKLIGGILITTYVFFVISFASILLTEVFKLFK